jgi:MOSC domain-containing protein YiiM
MIVTSINIGTERTLRTKSKIFVSGIHKEPVDGPVQVTTLGLEGDVIKDHRNHGGVDQAVYIYGQVDYDWWSAELGYLLNPGTFGENLTISELESADFKVGDRLNFGGVVLEVSAPRIPCATLAARMGDSQFVKKFRKAERPGLYCRVIQPGMVESSQTVKIQRYGGDTVSILEMFREYYERDTSEAGLRRYLAAPIDIRSRQDKERQLEEQLKES